jgi:hypothetical protein
LDISPSIAEMGLSELRIVFPSADVPGGSIIGFDQTIKAGQGRVGPTLWEIPFLKLRIRITTHQRLTSRMVILPVHYEHSTLNTHSEMMMKLNGRWITGAPRKTRR